MYKISWVDGAILRTLRATNRFESGREYAPLLLYSIVKAGHVGSNVPRARDQDSRISTRVIFGKSDDYI